MIGAPHYPIRAVARMTGLSVDTLRAWERRYEAVVPDRSQRGRVYTERHVDRLRRLAALVAGGHAIGSIASLPDAALRKLRVGGGEGADPPASAAIDLEPLLIALRSYDLEHIESLVARFAVTLLPSEFVLTVALPVLRELGRRWEARQVSPAQEHLVSGSLRGVLGGLVRTLPKRAAAPRIVFATPAGEAHELGLLCGAVLAAASGYAVVYLGPNLPAAEIVHAVKQAEARTLVLASTTSTVNSRDLRTLRRLPKPIAVWVGGAQAASVQTAIGARARLIPSLEAFGQLLDRHAA